MFSFKIEYVCMIPKTLKCRAALRKNIFILRLCYSPYKHNGYGIFQFFSIVGVLGSPSMPQNHYLSRIPFTRRPRVKKTYKEIK